MHICALLSNNIKMLTIKKFLINFNKQTELTRTTCAQSEILMNSFKMSSQNDAIFR